MISWSIYVATNGISFFSMAKHHTYVCVCVCVHYVHIHIHTYIYTQHIFIHSSLNGHLGCFRILAIVNSAAMKIGLHVSFWVVFFSGYMPKNGTAGWYRNTIFNSLSFPQGILLLTLEDTARITCLRVLLCCSGLKTWCHCSGFGCCCGTGFNPWPRNFYMLRAWPKK